MSVNKSLVVACLLLLPVNCFAQFPNSVICQFEKIATAELNVDGKLVVKGEESKGDMVLSKLNSDAPEGTGNAYTTKLHVLRRSKDAIWLAEYPADDVVVVMTVFFKTGIIMSTKHETISRPFGFVEIGRCRTPK